MTDTTTWQAALNSELQAAMDERDAGIINAHAEELNEEALDVLGYQGGDVKRGELYRVERPHASEPKAFAPKAGREWRK